MSLENIAKKKRKVNAFLYFQQFSGVYSLKIYRLKPKTFSVLQILYEMMFAEKKFLKNIIVKSIYSLLF